MPWFAHGMHNGVPIGEDVAFCLTAMKCGFEVWGDSSVQALHVKPALVGEVDYVRSVNDPRHYLYDKRHEIPIYQKLMGELDGNGS